MCDRTVSNESNSLSAPRGVRWRRDGKRKEQGYEHSAHLHRACLQQKDLRHSHKVSEELLNDAIVRADITITGKDPIGLREFIEKNKGVFERDRSESVVRQETVV